MTPATPRFPMPVNVPASVHAHVREKNQVAGEAHQHPLATGLDAFNQTSRKRGILINPRQMR